MGQSIRTRTLICLVKGYRKRKMKFPEMAADVGMSALLLKVELYAKDLISRLARSITM